MASNEIEDRAEPDSHWMRQALALAGRAGEQGEVPVGAIVVLDGKVIGEGSNAPIGKCDASAHAEINALRHAGRKLGNYRLPGCTLYVTIEPCSMCAGAMVHARVSELVFGALEPRAGVVQSQGNFFDQDFLNHRVQWRGGVLADECGRLLKDFFAARR